MHTDINYTARLIREPLKQRSENWKETAHHWLVTLYGNTFDYYTGMGHREPKRRDDSEYSKLRLALHLNDYGFMRLLAISKPVPPEADAVLHSLIWDASAAEQTFEEWCLNCGYNDDSIKALETYRLCQQNAVKLTKAGVNIEKERKRLEDLY